MRRSMCIIMIHHGTPIVARFDLAGLVAQGLVAQGLAPQSLNDHGAAGFCYESTNQFPILSLLKFPHQSADIL